MALQEVDTSTQLHQDIKHIRRAASRAQDLVEQILIFSRQAEQGKALTKVSLIIDEVLKLIGVAIPQNITIEKSVTTDLDTIIIAPSQMHRVIMNICTNAYYAMHAKGGVLSVSLNFVEYDDNAPRPSKLMRQSQYVHLSITDSGIGMDADTRKHIFEPFFTTKETGKGSGLGLSVAYGIVKDHDGAIVVRSEKGQGSTFDIYLPYCHDTAYLEKELDERHATVHEHLRILFIDDEVEIVTLFKDMLSRVGHHVTIRTSSIVGKDVFLESPQDFDLIIVGQNMPEMTGIEIAEQIHAQYPAVPIFLIAGVNEGVNYDDILKVGILEVLVKPVSYYTMNQAILRVIRSRKAKEERS